MKLRHLFITSLLLVFTSFGFSQNKSVQGNKDENSWIIFTSQDKDFLQQWHNDQMLTMDLNEEGREYYLSLLNYYTYKMSRIGLPKYGYTDAERKVKFDALAEKLDADMVDLLNAHDYKIHKISFIKIKEIVYNKRGWKD